jgi:hypothetical protein
MGGPQSQLEVREKKIFGSAGMMILITRTTTTITIVAINFRDDVQ